MDSTISVALIRSAVARYKPNAIDFDDAYAVALSTVHFSTETYRKIENPTAKLTTYVTQSIKFNLMRMATDDDTAEREILNENKHSYKEDYKDWMRSLVADKLQLLDARESEIIKRSFGIERDEQTVREIGIDLGISHVRVVQIRQRAIEKLRNILNSILTPLSV